MLFTNQDLHLQQLYTQSVLTNEDATQPSFKIKLINGKKFQQSLLDDVVQ